MCTLWAALRGGASRRVRCAMQAWLHVEGWWRTCADFGVFACGLGCPSPLPLTAELTALKKSLTAQLESERAAWAEERGGLQVCGCAVGRWGARSRPLLRGHAWSVPTPAANCVSGWYSTAPTHPAAAARVWPADCHRCRGAAAGCRVAAGRGAGRAAGGGAVGRQRRGGARAGSGGGKGQAAGGTGHAAEPGGHKIIMSTQGRDSRRTQCTPLWWPG